MQNFRNLKWNCHLGNIGIGDFRTGRPVLEITGREPSDQRRRPPTRARCSTSPRRRRTRGSASGSPSGAGARSQNLQNLQNLQNFANFERARSRLYQNEILQENMRLTAFFKLYKICILLHRCNLKIFAKNRYEKSAKFQQNFCKCCKICKILPNFKNFS